MYGAVPDRLEDKWRGRFLQEGEIRPPLHGADDLLVGVPGARGSCGAGDRRLRARRLALIDGASQAAGVEGQVRARRRRAWQVGRVTSRSRTQRSLMIGSRHWSDPWYVRGILRVEEAGGTAYAVRSRLRLRPHIRFRGLVSGGRVGKGSWVGKLRADGPGTGHKRRAGGHGAAPLRRRVGHVGEGFVVFILSGCCVVFFPPGMLCYEGGESMIALESDARSYTRSDRRMCSNKKIIKAYSGMHKALVILDMP